MQRAYVTRRPGIVIQSASDFRDQDSQIRVGHERVWPEVFVQLRFREGTRPDFNQCLPQLEGFGREVDRVRPARELAGFVIQCEWAK
jgi:hypothetical protein